MAGDIPKVLSLMADDVVFMVPGKKPFGKEEFAASARQLKDVKMQGKSEIEELEVLDGWAWCRNRLAVTMSPPSGKPVRRSGYTLTILRKNPDGAWVLACDANLLTTE